MSQEHLALARERIGRVLRDRWLLEKVIGAGGMAAVYQARHRNGARAAIKLLHGPVGEDDVLRERFLREGYLANILDHPGVARVLDDDADPAFGPFIVMELLEGGSLLDLLERGETFDGARATMIADKTLDVLVVAHRRGIVHRDLKPANLFLCDPPPGGGDPAVKVLDFGIARLLDASSARLTRTGVPLGTPAYMAPEQARGLGRHVDGRADIYALGATIFRLLTGRHVHAGRGAEQIARVATERAPTLASVAPHVPPDVCAVIDRALQLDPDERYPSAEEMQAAVRAVRGGRPPTLARSAVRTPVAMPVPEVERLVESVREEAHRRARRPDAFSTRVAGSSSPPTAHPAEESDDNLPTVVKNPGEYGRAELAAVLARARAGEAAPAPSRPPSSASFPRIGNVPVPQMTPSGGVPSARHHPPEQPRHEAGAPTMTLGGAIVLPPAVPATFEDTQYRLEGMPPSRSGAPSAPASPIHARSAAPSPPPVAPTARAPSRPFAATLVEPDARGFERPVEPPVVRSAERSPMAREPVAASWAQPSAASPVVDPRSPHPLPSRQEPASQPESTSRGWIFAFAAVLLLIVLAVVGAVLRLWG